MKNIIIEGGEKMKYENVDRLLQGLVDKGLPGCTLTYCTAWENVV